MQYGIPLAAYMAMAAPLLDDMEPNSMYRSTALDTPDDTEVVLPNVDTLYGSSVLDLSKDNVNVTVPAIGDDRYYSFSFFDPYACLPLDLYAHQLTLYQLWRKLCCRW
jgi:hypothetical protein